MQNAQTIASKFFNMQNVNSALTLTSTQLVALDNPQQQHCFLTYNVAANAHYINVQDIVAQHINAQVCSVEVQITPCAQFAVTFNVSCANNYAHMGDSEEASITQAIALVKQFFNIKQQLCVHEAYAADDVVYVCFTH